MSSGPRELLIASERQRRQRLEEEDAPPPAHRRAPGKLTSSDAEDPAVWRQSSPGKLTRADAGLDTMTAAAALRQVTIDRRATDDTDVGDGALASAFDFLEDVRGGAPLPEALARRLAAELRIDLSQVRIHTDEAAAAAARAIGARAFTIGDDIYFAAGAYDPTSEAGIDLIAHEVAHVAQQRTGQRRDAGRVSRPDDAHEREADQFARHFRSDDPASLVDFVRLQGKPFQIPNRGELEERLGMPLDFVEAYTGDAARAACQMMAAGAFAVSNIVAFADDSPQKEHLLHELAHVVQMGKKVAPAKFAPGSLRVGDENAAAEHDARAVVTGAAVGANAPADVIHRVKDEEETTQEWTIDEAKTRFRAYARSAKLPKRKKGERHVFAKLDNEAVHYLNTSSKPFTLSDYRAAVKGMAKYKKLSEADLEKDLKEIHKEGSGEGLVQVGEAGKRWGWIDPAENPPTNVSYLLETVYERKEISEYYAVYCEALAELKLLSTKPTVQFKDQALCVFKVDEDGQPTSEGELKKCRTALEKAITGEKKYKLNAKKGEWDNYFSDVVESKKRFPNKMVGDWFEIIAGRDMGEKLGKTVHVGNVVFPSDHPDLTNDEAHVSDGLVLEGANLKRTGLMEAKTGPSSPELAQAAAYATILKEGIKAVDVPATKRKGPFTKCTYVFTTKALAKAWIPGLKAAFKAKGQLSKLVVVPDPDAKGFAALTFNPTLQVPLAKPEGTHHHLTSPKVSHPGMTFRSMDLVTKEPNSEEVVSGSVTFDMNLAGGVKGEKVTKKVKDGTVENKFEGLKTSLDKILKRVKPSAKLTDDGVEGTLEITAGASGIPKINLEDSHVTVKYNASGQLTAEGEIKLAHTNGKIRGRVKVGWDGSNWSFLGTADVSAGMVEGLSDWTAHVKYEGGHWSFGLDKVDYVKKFKAIELRGKALGVEYDIDKGHFTGLLQIEADLGLFGKASASAELKENKLKRAELNYDSPELKYPKDKPVIVGTVGGTVTYDDGKFSGGMRGTANLDLPALKKFADGGVALSVDAHINKDGSYGGSIGTDSEIKLGKHFKVGPLRLDLLDDGSLKGHFAAKIYDFKYLDEASIACEVGPGYIKIDSAKIAFHIGDPTKDRMSARGTISYEDAKGFVIHGDVDARLTDNLKAHGSVDYTSETDNVDLKLWIDPITLFDYHQKHRLFEFSKQIPLFSFLGIIGLYLDLGFDLDFNFDFDLKLAPKLALTGLNAKDWSYESVDAEVSLLGSLQADLVASPKLGLGLFILHPMLLRGGGGLKLPVTARARLEPSASLHVGYDKAGNVSKDASLGLRMTFGIFAELKAFAELVVLDGMWELPWESESLGRREILPEKELFNKTIDFGKELKKETPAIPAMGQAPAKGPPPDAVKQVDEQKSGNKDAEPKKSETDKEPAEKGDAGPFDVDSLKPILEGIPGYQKAKRVFDKAARAYKFVKDLIGKIIRAVGNFLTGGLLDVIEDLLDGLSREGVGYLRVIIRRAVGDTIYEIIEPLVEVAVQTADEILDLLEMGGPDGAGGLLPWALKAIGKLLSIGFHSFTATVEALWEIGKNLKSTARKLVTQMVQDGLIGVQRHCYYIWKPFGPNWYFLAATQYKINILGFSSYHKEEGMLNNPKSAIGIALFEVLEWLEVPPTFVGWESDAEEPYNDRWVGEGAGVSQGEQMRQIMEDIKRRQALQQKAKLDETPQRKGKPGSGMEPVMTRPPKL